MKRKAIICRRCESCGRLGDVERAAVFIDQLEANVVRWRRRLLVMRTLPLVAMERASWRALNRPVEPRMA